MTGPLEQMRFTDEEIDHAVKALSAFDSAKSDQPSYLNSDRVRVVLRAVRAVPARCLNGGLTGHPARPGDHVQGTGVGGVRVRGTVRESYPVTTTVRTPSGGIDYLWTNTLHSWDPSTDEEMQGRDAVRTIEVTGPVTDPEVEGMVPVGVNLATGGIVFMDPNLIADDDGMAVEADR